MDKTATSGRRLLKLLSRRTEAGYSYEGSEISITIFAGRPVSFDRRLVDDLARKGMVQLQGTQISLTRTGLERLKEQIGIAPLPCEPEQRHVVYKNKTQPSTNLNESPLSRLFVRKTKSGASYLSQPEFNAGERLRMDFEKGNLQPRISANLGMTAGLSGKGGIHQAHEISDFALDARNRLNQAIEELGPELSGVALDICCFLKGLETVEKERQWPPRSAKLMLKTALSKLARHYGFVGGRDVGKRSIGSWGIEGYRPQI